VDRPVSRTRERGASGAFVWQFWSSSGWLDLEVIDQTESMSRSGLVSFVIPEKALVNPELADGTCHWLRITARPGGAGPLAQLRGVLRNTTMATHSIRLQNEVLGSSDGTLNQRFTAARTPILKDIVLQVLEADLPADAERVLRSLPADATEVLRDERGRPLAVWVRWSETADFLGSGPEDRHYTVDRQTGEIRFGDGRHGRIPPRNGNNIRLRRYQVGGGSRGNKPANTITQLRSAVPYVEAATNLVAASGGFDREDMPSVYGRGARLLRHRGRAVTAEDYEDLALLASPEVARARCVPMRDLAADPDAHRSVLGIVSLIVVSRSDAKKPLSSVPLLDRVRQYVDERRDPAANLIVLGPEYVQVSVETELVPEVIEESAAVRDAVTQRIDAFLHPLSGGPGNRGWDFGVLPHRSDLYGVCASVPGVHHVSSLRIVTLEERLGVTATGNFLIYSGEHHVRIASAVRHDTPV
jgi:predicted phage baseplate assembly protein